MAGQALVLTPGDGYGSGYGSGSGSGYGSGDGDGSGYGYGDGSGDGYGSGDGDGYGSGDGDGSGYGYGDGSGYGSGDGDGSGDGYGYGYGYGSGYGSGSGDGSGYGYGSGDGSGYGYGSGYGGGSGEAARLLDAYLSHPLVSRELEAGETVTLGWWRSDARGLSANGGRDMAPAQPGLYQEVDGPLQLCTGRALHASCKPSEWNGSRWWIVALLGPVKQEGTKAGALRRLIIEEVN